MEKYMKDFACVEGKGKGKRHLKVEFQGAARVVLISLSPTTRELHVNYLFPFLPTSLIYHFLFTHEGIG